MNKLYTVLIFFFILSMGILPAQETEPPGERLNNEDSDDPELEAYKKEQQAYFDTGFELYIHYPVSLHLPGWSYPRVSYDFLLNEIYLPGPNVSWGGLGAGFEIDFGSRKKGLRNMGFGSLIEINILSSFNMMDSVDMGLLLNYPYLYYSTKRAEGLNFTVRAGMGLGIALDSSDLFAYPEEKDQPFGALYALEGALLFPYGNFCFQTGAAYRFLAINSKNIHMLTVLLRAGYRF